MSSKTTSISDWLIDAKSLNPGDQLNLYLRDHKGPPPTWPDMRAALYAQFGEDTPIRIWKHGDRICIFIHPDEDSRSRFDQRCGLVVIRHGGKRTEHEYGFTRELPGQSSAKPAQPY